MNVVTIETKHIENKMMTLLLGHCTVARCRFSDGQGFDILVVRHDQGITWKSVSGQARREAI
jgi:hypothetical protein